MPDQNPFRVPDGTPDCAKPVNELPSSLHDEFFALAQDPTAKRTDNTTGTHFESADGKAKFTAYVDQGGVVVKNDLSGQRDKFILDYRFWTEKTYPDGKGGTIEAKTFIDPSFKSQVGTRKDAAGDVTGRYFLNFDPGGNATSLECRDAAGTVTYKAKPELPSDK